MHFFTIILKTTIMFCILLFLARVLGKKQMSHLTFFNYITGITIGSIAANVLCDPNIPYLNGTITLAWWCSLTGLVGIIGLKSKQIRKIVDGEPCILINKGQINQHNLKSSRLCLEDLCMLLRKQNIFSISDVEYAILEQNGELSVMKKQLQQQVTKEDLNIPQSTSSQLPLAIIIDGELNQHNLKELNLNEEWLRSQLSKQNIFSIKEVLYAECKNNMNLIIQRYH